MSSPYMQIDTFSEFDRHNYYDDEYEYYADEHWWLQEPPDPMQIDYNDVWFAEDDDREC